MPSNQTQSAEPSAGGNGIFIALIPWIIFTVLVSHATLKIGSIVALVAAVVIAAPLMWACIFAAMVPFHAIAGTADTRLGNIIFNWAIPLGLVCWGIKRSSAAGDSETAPVQKVA